DSMTGGDGFDTVDYSGRTVSVAVSLDGNANDGNDPSHTGNGTEGDDVDATTEVVLGGRGGDTLTGSDATDDMLFGDEGNDVLNGGLGNAQLDAGPGGDTLFGGPDCPDDSCGDDVDVLDGGSGSDVMCGGLGNDLFYLQDGFADTADGGLGTNLVG